MKHKLKDGRVVDIVPLSSKIPVKWFLEFSNSFVEEDSYLLHDRKFTLKEKKEWLDDALKNVRKKEWIYLAVIDGKRIVGTCSAKKGIGREMQNIIIGISVVKDFRRAGLGEFLMRKTIADAKKRLSPREIYLHVPAVNKPAIRLYERIGFREMARFPEWMKHKGKYYDVIWMLLKKEEK